MTHQISVLWHNDRHVKPVQNHQNHQPCAPTVQGQCERCLTRSFLLSLCTVTNPDCSGQPEGVWQTYVWRPGLIVILLTDCFARKVQAVWKVMREGRIHEFPVGDGLWLMLYCSLSPPSLYIYTYINIYITYINKHSHIMQCRAPCSGSSPGTMPVLTCRSVQQHIILHLITQLQIFWPIGSLQSACTNCADLRHSNYAALAGELQN